MRILVTGETGQLGREIAQQTWPPGVDVVVTSRARLNLADAGTIEQFIINGNFDLVINAAAYTAVDNAESDALQAWAVNAGAVAALAEATRKTQIPLIHISTDYVFNGAKQGAYIETDAIDPINIYGASKAAGELAVRAINPHHLILRTSWIFAAHGNNFVKTMLKLSKHRSVLSVVDDQIGCPTSAKDLALALVEIAISLRGNPMLSGTYHFTNEGAISWCGFAREIFRQTNDAGFMVPEVEPIATADYPTAARRPANSVLSHKKLWRNFSIRPRPWTDALAEVLKDLGYQAPISSEDPR